MFQSLEATQCVFRCNNVVETMCVMLISIIPCMGYINVLFIVAAVTQIQVVCDSVPRRHSSCIRDSWVSSKPMRMLARIFSNHSPVPFSRMISTYSRDHPAGPQSTDPLCPIGIRIRSHVTITRPLIRRRLSQIKCRCPEKRLPSQRFRHLLICLIIGRRRRKNGRRTRTR